jgi:apolipoprotein N-acyltransferase
MPEHVRHDDGSAMTRYPALLSLVLGAVAACGFAPLELVAVALLALAGWILLVHAAPTFRAALWRGWLFGVGHFTVNNNWFQHAFDFQDQMPPVLGYFAAVGLALYLAVYPMLAAGIAWRFRARRIDAAFVLVLAAAWIATEYLRATLLTGYAWDPLGVLWVPVQPVAELAAWVGTYALSGLTIAAAGALLWVTRRSGARLAALAAVVIAITAAPLVSYRSSGTNSAPAAPRLMIVQPNIGQDARGDDDAELVLSRLERLSGRPTAGRRVLFWPEGVVRDWVEDGYPWWSYRRATAFHVRRRMARLLGPDDRLLFGGTALRFDREDELVGAANSVFALDPAARLVGRYDKAHLVPFGEYLPWSWLLRPLGLSRLVPGDIDFDSGPGPRALDVPGIGPVGVQLCYEIIFSGQVVERGHRPRLLFNPSNDAWFGRWGPPQHLAQARMRAIEEGLPIVRTTPTGISAAIAADGRLLATIPHERAGAITVPLPPALPPTLFARAGNTMAAIVAVLLFGLGVALQRRRR